MENKQDTEERLADLKAVGWAKLNQSQRDEWQRLKKIVEDEKPVSAIVAPKAEEEKRAIAPSSKGMTTETAVKELSSCLYSIVAILGKYLRINAGAAGMSDQQLRDLIRKVENINKTLNG